jgi:hypothetical protein
MPITFTSITFTTPDELVEVVSRLDDVSIRELMNALGSKGSDTQPEITKPSPSVSKQPKVSTAGKTTPKRMNRPRGSEGSLVDQIKRVIEGFISENQEFTANSVFEALDTGKAYVNKKSVVSSVQKLMREGEFAKIPRKDRRDGAPRAKKVYLPK